MKETLFQAIQIILSVFEIWLCYQLLFETVIEKEYLRKIDRCIMWGNIFILGVLLGINREIVFFSNGMFVVSIVMTGFCAIIMDRKKRIIIFLIIIAYYSILTLMDYYFAFISMPVWREDFFHEIYWHTLSWGKCLIFTISRIILSTGILWIKKRDDLRYSLPEFCTSLIMMDVVFCMLIIQYQMIMASMSVGLQRMNGEIAGMSLLILIVIFVLIWALLLKNKIIQKDNRFLIMQDEILWKKYQDLVTERENNKRLIHDIRNHFLVLKECEKNRSYNQMHTYLQEIEKEFKDVEVRMWTGNQVIDLILEQKRAIAEEQGISFFIQTVPISKWPLKDTELCSLFGNLLDNAIEANEKIKCGTRKIAVNIKKQGKIIFIKIENTIEKKPVIEKNRFISTKTNAEMHGYGLKNVKKIVNIHQGELIYEIKDNVFKISISFFYE